MLTIVLGDPYSTQPPEQGFPTSALLRAPPNQVALRQRRSRGGCPGLLEPDIEYEDLAVRHGLFNCTRIDLPEITQGTRIPELPIGFVGGLEVAYPIVLP